MKREIIPNRTRLAVRATSVVLAWLVAAVTVASAASATPQRQTSTVQAGFTTTVVQLVVAEQPADPGAPLRSSSRVLAAEIGRFAPAAPAAYGSACDVTFDDSDALLIQTNHAQDQFLVDPWREQCGSAWTEITASTYNHLHLGFVDPEIGPCFNPDEALAGSYARIVGADPWTATCQAFDPLTEPRTSPYSHFGDAVIKVRLYDEDGYTSFRLDRIRVKNTAIRLCAQPAELTGAYIAQGPVEPGAMAGASCWNLEPGLWDLSGHTADTGIVTLTGAHGNDSPFSFDDLELVAHG